jgi:CRISPR-associated protein Csb1
MNIEQFDSWLRADGPVAVAIREELEPVSGADSVFFPPTFAPPKDSKDAPGYVIDATLSSGNVALVDTVGAQANRIEPIFKQAPYSELVPKASVRIGEREIHLLDAGHRAADAVVRSCKRRSLRFGTNATRRRLRSWPPHRWCSASGIRAIRR